MHLDALSPDRQTLLPTLALFTEFYLAGGTALALQLGHRESVDFDLFTHQPIEPSLLGRVERSFAGATVTPLVNTADELTVTIRETKLTFLAYPFQVLEPFVTFQGIRLLSVPELATTKAYTLGRRGSLKDYVDLYTVVSGGHSTLPAIVNFAERKYAGSFNTRLFLEQLIWLEDVEDEPIRFLRQPVSRSTIQAFFTEQVHSYRIEDPPRER